MAVASGAKKAPSSKGGEGRPSSSSSSSTTEGFEVPGELSTSKKKKNHVKLRGKRSLRN
jgi:hypothetical protein